MTVIYTPSVALSSVTPVVGSTGTFSGQLVGGGTATNNNAAAGQIGEFQTAVLASGSAISLTSGVDANVTSISLTAGDWEVRGGVVFVAAATTTISRLRASSSITSGALTAAPDGGGIFIDAPFTTGPATNALPVGVFRYSLASTTTIFLIASAAFGVSTMTAYGSLYARRVR